MDQSLPDFDLVNRMQNDCVRLTHLMDSVLSFSKPVEFNLANIDLGNLLSNLLERWGPRMRRLNIIANYEATTDKTLVVGDLRSLEQVFVNLVNNAVQAMEKTGGSLSIKAHEITTSETQPMVEVTVSDSGPGIPDDIRDHIFEPFMTTNQNGTGLGLAISKRIIAAHKGNIFVESFTGGTIFHVLLPKSNGDIK
jgi:signal transduction histidine kinase